MSVIVWIGDVGEVLNIVSIVCSATVLFTLVILAIHNYRLVNRISLRLTAGIAVVDILNHVNNIVHRFLADGRMCVFSGLLRVAGRQMYCFLNIAIAVNLQLIFINGLRPSARWEMFYWGIPIFLVTVMNGPPLWLFGHDGDRCFIKSDDKNQERILLVINLSCVMIITFLYCCGVTLVVGFRLRSKLRIVQNLAPTRFQRDIEAASVEKSLKKLLFRITLYPLTFIISMFFYFVVTIMYVLETGDATIGALATLGLSLTGMLGFGAFLMDPTLHVASKSMMARFLPLEKHYSPEKSYISDSSSTIELSRIPLTYRQFDSDPTSNEPRVGGNNNLRLL